MPRTSRWQVPRSGSPCRFLGQVGIDAIGDALLAEMASAGVDVTSVRRSGSTGTIVALVDAAGERSMLTDRRACVDLAAPEPSWLDAITILHVPLYSLADGQVATTATTVIGWAHERRIDVAIDVSSTALIEALGVDRVRALLDVLRPGVVFANRDEAAALSIDGPVAGSVTVVKRGPDPAIVLRARRRSHRGARDHRLPIRGHHRGRRCVRSGLPAAPGWVGRRSDRCLCVRPPLGGDTAPGPDGPAGR